MAHVCQVRELDRIPDLEGAPDAARLHLNPTELAENHDERTPGERRAPNKLQRQEGKILNEV